MTQQIAQLTMADLVDRISQFTSAVHTAAHTTDLKTVVRKIETIIRTFKFEAGLAIRRSKKTLDGQSLLKYQISNTRRANRFYTKNRDRILAEQKERRISKIAIESMVKNDS